MQHTPWNIRPSWPRAIVLLILAGTSLLAKDPTTIFFSDTSIEIPTGCESTSLTSVSCPKAKMAWDYVPVGSEASVAKSLVKDFKKLWPKLKKKKVSCTLAGVSGSCYKIRYTDVGGRDHYLLLAYAQVNSRGIVFRCELVYSWDAALPESVASFLSFY